MDISTVRAMKNTDVRTVDKSLLVDLKDIEINPKALPEEKRQSMCGRSKTHTAFYATVMR